MERKKTKSTPDSNRFDVKSLIQDNSPFFDKLVDLIPARFYLPSADDDKPWFQGLSKIAKASAKKETRENMKKARRNRLDPEKPTTTLQLLNKSIQNEKSETQKEPPSEEDNNNRSVTFQELRQRYHQKLEELRGNRPDKAELEKRRGLPKGKRKRDAALAERKAESGTVASSASGASSVKADDVAFGHVKIGDEDGKKRKKQKLSKLQTLEKAKKLVEARKDPEKGEIVSKKHSWKAAVSRAAGVKVHDDPKLLKQSIKKDKKRHEKNVEKWKDRVESREKVRSEKQQTRSGNISERIHQKKMRRIAKREKKLMRPGFEGRKDGFINGS